MFNKQVQSTMKLLGVKITLAVLLLGCLAAQLSLQAPPPETNAKLQKGLSGGNDTCGTLNDLALRVEICAKPLMDILQGTIERWPRTDEDVSKLCESFLVSERCIRDVGRKCAKGFHKTIISTLANSVQRVRKRECLKSKYQDILKTTQCIEKNQEVSQAIMNSANNKFLVIAKQIKDLDHKTTAVCCMVYEIEDQINLLIKPRCPSESVMVLRLYRGVLEDVRELICRSPKCGGDFLRGNKVENTKDPGGIIMLLLAIVFSLGN